MFNFAVFDKSGRIIRWGHCGQQGDVGLQIQNPNEMVVESDNPISSPDKYYVVNDMVTERPVLPRFILNKNTIVADGIDTLTISPLPNPTIVKVDSSAPITVTDGVFELSSNTSGVFDVLVDPFPYAVQEFIVNAT